MHSLRCLLCISEKESGLTEDQGHLEYWEVLGEKMLLNGDPWEVRSMGRTAATLPENLSDVLISFRFTPPARPGLPSPHVRTGSKPSCFPTTCCSQKRPFGRTLELVCIWRLYEPNASTHPED